MTDITDWTPKKKKNKTKQNKKKQLIRITYHVDIWPDRVAIFKDHQSTFRAVSQHPHQRTTQRTAMLWSCILVDIDKKNLQKTPVYSIYEAEGEGIEATL